MAIMTQQRIERLVTTWLNEALAVQRRLHASGTGEIAAIAGEIVATFGRGGKLMLFGNGGSAADAQHIATEFTARFRLDRPALPALSLSTDTSALTAIGNDFAFEQVFARQVAALGRPGDLAIGISTSGNSPNVLAGVAEARTRGIATVGFCGAGGALPAAVDLCFRAPADGPSHIQEAHLAAWHAICDAVERVLFEEE